MKAEQAWQAAVGQLQMEMQKAAFDTWVRDTEMISFEDGIFIVGVKNAYARDWLTERLSSTVNRMLTGILNRTVQVRFVVWQNPNPFVETYEAEEAPASLAQVEQAAASAPTLARRYTFHNFVVGASNRLPHAACLAVAEKPAEA